MSYKEFNLDLNPHDDNIPESKVDEDAVYISLDLNKLEHKGRIRSKLIDQEKELFTNFLLANKDVFACFAEDMPGVGPFMICHCLHL
ncbi:hypothetical protein D8674_008537 [Pyrus ussuriensis x Pyrus communis]|uniref:Uncharacterized protein n=1 Tax=Pyrus ussuriensis x Pyrus communis TaxID=2448454 RepID=A0A5N5HTZ0_9ROSA|nr:hypothetical protein D8674_008537 [Pyrus ussuriensis x Pyrus communis]